MDDPVTTGDGTFEVIGVAYAIQDDGPNVLRKRSETAQPSTQLGIAGEAECKCVESVVYGRSFPANLAIGL